jgi:molybdopterin-guanine dinucleotide biosynthesis protein A
MEKPIPAPMPASPSRKPIGVLLAGGLSRRMGGGIKTFKQLGGRPILEHVIERFKPQCATLVLNVNEKAEGFANTGLPLIPDTLPDHVGPLAGILAALEWVAAHHPDCDTLASVATDSPFLPDNLVLRLEEARQAAKTPLACAQSGQKRHPPFGLWPVALRHALRAALVSEHLRKMDVFMTRHGCATAVWNTDPFDPFFNVNHPEDLIEAETYLARLKPKPHPAA